MSTHDLRSTVFITTEELTRKLEHRNSLVILDIRANDRPEDDVTAYLDAHIPDAVRVDFAELAGEPSGYSGRRPLPAIQDLQRNARRWGITDGSEVVVYDDAQGLKAGRAWWVLKSAGVNVRLLDGGLAAWQAAGLQTTQRVPAPAPGTVTLSEGNLPVLDADQAAALAREGILLDARGAASYRGGPVDAGKPLEGHIPGAFSAPTSQTLEASGLLAAPAALKERFAGLGVDAGTNVGVYCGAGVAAAHQVAVLASIGIPAALFPGSWSAWSADPSRPVATGELPG